MPAMRAEPAIHAWPTKQSAYASQMGAFFRSMAIICRSLLHVHESRNFDTCAEELDTDLIDH